MTAVQIPDPSESRSSISADSRIKIVSKFLIPSNVKALILDFDGTVTNTHDFHNDSLLLALQHLLDRPLDVREFEVIGDPCRLSEKDICEFMTRTFLLPEMERDEELCAKIEAMYDSPHGKIGEISKEAAVEDLTKLMIADRRVIFSRLFHKKMPEVNPGIMELLKYCEENDIKVGICTGSPHSVVEAVIHAHNLAEYFDEDLRICAEDYAGVEGKPHPHCWELAVERTGCEKEEVVALENSHAAIAAVRAGLVTVVCPSEYGRNVDEEKQKLSPILDKYGVEDPKEIAIVESWECLGFEVRASA